MPAIAYLRLHPYSTAIFSVGVALLLMLELDPIARMTQSPFLLFFGAVVVSAWQGGIRSGLVATGLAALISDYFFMEPKYSLAFAPSNAVRLMVFVLECVLVSILCGSLRTTNQQLARNLSKLKASEESLRTANQSITDILESITDGFYTLDRQWRFAYINSQAEQILRRSRDELLRQSVWEKFPGARGTLFEQSFYRAVSEVVPVVFESCGVVNPERWFEVHVNPLHDGLAVYFQDVTERKQAEQERERLLERERAAREEAEAANRIKDEFLAVLSHELRSPLNPILGWSQLLRSGILDATKTAHALETIERNAKLQTQLIEDLLDVSRILRGKLSLTRAPVDLAATIEAALETVRLATQAKSIQIHMRLDSTTGQVLGDSTRLQQVVWNLLANAVKFTPTGGQIEIRLEKRGSQAQIQVADTGKGIPPDFLPHVFEYFRQADATTTRKFGGLGLGLAIVRNLVELHGGTVWAESPGEERGATFTVRLPLMSVPTQTPQEQMPEAPVAHLTGLRILVVDDEPDIRHIVAFILEQAGATVSVAASAAEALNLMGQSLPDVLISDIGMPDMDGYMLIRQIRTLPPEQGGKIQAIALTAYATEVDRQQALAAGFQQHIAKPFEPEELVRVISALVKGISR
ncbi:MAG TPA: hybrid sensor histidine kinase/response regulator [Cyanobacteria bacterium UBA8803]|nr:hybrid sensor histidine kinase/response regulator [Cyanobacteria bacterium UBA9273]HBL60311.1 hybrid sensor histidine kinase/response regulator [Cyanobacteria bacterium UBA8803]